MILDASANKHLIKRKRKDAFFRVVCFLAATIGVILLLTFLSKIVVDGMPKLSWKFIVGDMSTRARSTGIWQAVVGSIYVMVLTAIISVPVGVAAAIYLEEFTRRKNRFTDLIQLNIANLSGVPSIVYGLLGRVLFVYFFGFPSLSHLSISCLRFWWVYLVPCQRFGCASKYGRKRMRLYWAGLVRRRLYWAQL